MEKPASSVNRLICRVSETHIARPLRHLQRHPRPVALACSRASEQPPFLPVHGSFDVAEIVLIFQAIPCVKSKCAASRQICGRG